MNPVINKNHFLVKEHVGLFKAANNFDIFDPDNGQIIIECREPNLGFFTKLLRFSDYKRMTPFELVLKTPDGQPILTVKRGVALFLSTVKVLDEAGNHIGGFKQKFFTIGGAFRVLDDQDQPICELKGKWTGWNFRFMAGEEELANVSKKWAGSGKELFTSADNYMLTIDPSVEPGHPVRLLILAAVMSIDMVLKE